MLVRRAIDLGRFFAGFGAAEAEPRAQVFVAVQRDLPRFRGPAPRPDARPPAHGLFARAPYLHTGCAPALQHRFGPCGGGEAHGHTAQLSAVELTDLVVYLETL